MQKIRIRYDEVRSRPLFEVAIFLSVHLLSWNGCKRQLLISTTMATTLSVGSNIYIDKQASQFSLPHG